jgi:hypothetical protein
MFHNGVMGMTMKNKTFLIVNIILLLSLTGCRGKLFAARPITSLKVSSLTVSNDEPSTVRRRDLSSSQNDIASIGPAKAERLFEPLGDGRLGTAERFIEPRAEKPGQAERPLEPRGHGKLAEAEHFLEPQAEKPGKAERLLEPRGEGGLSKEERLLESRSALAEPLIEKRTNEKAEKPNKDKK